MCPGVDWPEPGKEVKYFYLSSGTKCIVDLEHFGPVASEIGLTYEVKRFAGNYWAHMHQPPGPYSSVSPVPVTPQGAHTTHVSVTIPDEGILAIDEIFVATDSCTDALQGFLDEGWRILAVCPPALQRRPDYVLGRSPQLRGDRPPEYGIKATGRRRR